MTLSKRFEVLEKVDYDST